MKKCTSSEEEILKSSQTVTSMKGLINHDDINVIVAEQKNMLQQLEKVNQMLLNCNDISEKQFNALFSHLQQHTAVLVDMKKNLQYLHLHIRQLKSVVRERYPQTKSIGEAEKSKINVTSAIGLDDEKNNCNYKS